MASLISFFVFLGFFNADNTQLATTNNQIQADSHINAPTLYTKGSGATWNDLEEQ